MQCNALYCEGMQCNAMHCNGITVLHCIEVHCTELPSMLDPSASECVEVGSDISKFGLHSVDKSAHVQIMFAKYANMQR